MMKTAAATAQGSGLDLSNPKDAEIAELEWRVRELNDRVRALEFVKHNYAIIIRGRDADIRRLELVAWHYLSLAAMIVDAGYRPTHKPLLHRSVPVSSLYAEVADDAPVPCLPLCAACSYGHVWPCREFIREYIEEMRQS